MTCEGPDRGQNMQRNTIVLRIAVLLNMREVGYNALLTAPEQNLAALRWGFPAD